MEKNTTSMCVDLLPEVIIHHIQSFLTGKEAAQTATVCKSWRSAWLTRPDLYLDDSDFRFQTLCAVTFQDFAMETMQRYQDSYLNIHSLTLRSRKLMADLVVKALKLGATDLNLSFKKRTVVTKELLDSETLARLSLERCAITSGEVNWWRLNSLTLKQVVLTAVNVTHRILSRCCPSLQKLEIRSCRTSSPHNSIALHLYRFDKLEILLLENMTLHPNFFNDDFSSRFPLLKELCVDNCGVKRSLIKIGSPSLERVRLGGKTTWARAELDIPRMRKLEFSGVASNLQDSQVCMGTFCSQWESRVTIRLDKASGSVEARFLQRLRYFLMELRRSKISLCLTADSNFRFDEVEDGEYGVLPRVVVDNLTVDVPASCRRDLFKGLYGVCTALHINEP